MKFSRKGSCLYKSFPYQHIIHNWNISHYNFKTVNLYVPYLSVEDNCHPRCIRKLKKIYHTMISNCFFLAENNLTADSADLLISSPSSPRTFLSNVPCSSSSNEEVNGIGNGTVHPSHGRNHDKANRKKTKLVTHLSGSLSRAWGRARNRKSLDISSKYCVW